MASPQGLSLNGPASGTPPQLLRRARGIHEICTHEYRIAPGDTVITAATGIHSITRFADTRIYAAGTSIYAYPYGFVFANSNSNPLTFRRLPPGNSQPDRLFWVGGGNARKADVAHNVQNWGIAPPPDGFNMSAQPYAQKAIEDFNNSGDWTISATYGTGTPTGQVVVVANEGAIVESGTSLKVTVPADTVVSLTKPLTINLGQFGSSGDSSGEDFVILFVRVDGNSGSIEYITLRFDVGSGNFGSDYYQFKFLPTSITVNPAIDGVGSTPAASGDETQFVGDNGGTDETQRIVQNPSISDSWAPQGGTEFVASAGTWTKLQLTKSQFQRSGINTNTWANVVAMQLMVKTNQMSGLIAYFDTCLMRGGCGTLGDYQSLVTYDCSVTGARSNSNPTEQRVNQLFRQKPYYTALPVSPDSQVDRRSIWRTLGGGARFFHEYTVPDNLTTTYTSSVADFIGMWSNANSAILTLPELQTDNNKPDETYSDFIYDQATIFWISGEDTKKGLVFYSPPGRPESRRGFIRVTADDQPLYRIVVWQRARYVIGVAGWYRIDGTEPYVPYKFESIPGVLQQHARTVVPTPYGIIWRAKDGLRVFNGSSSDLLYPDRLTSIFRGENVENLNAFEGTYAAFARDQYFISDGTQTISCNFATGLIRDLGKGYSAFFWEEDTKQLVAGDAANLVIVEDQALGSSSRAFEIRTGSYIFPDSTVGWVDQIYLDTNMNIATTQAILDTVAHTLLPPVTSTARHLVELQVGYPCRELAVELQGSDTSGHALWGVEAAVRDCTLEVITPQGIISLKGRSSDLTQEIYFEVLADQRTAEPIDTNLLTYRLTIEATWNGASITPVIDWNEGSLTLAAITGTGRSLHQAGIYRPGHLAGVHLRGNFLTPITLYRAELELRPVTMELTTPQGVVQVIGKSASTTTSIYFELPEQQRVAEPFDVNLLTYGLLLDVDTQGGSFIPVLGFLEGLVTIEAITGTPRQLHYITPRQMGHFLGLELQGNLFLMNLFRTELELRQVTCDITMGEKALKLMGRSTDVRQLCWFELPEQQREVEPFDVNLLTYTLLLDMMGGALQPTLAYLEGTIALPSVSFPGPGRHIHRQLPIQMGHFIALYLTGNFFNATTFYRAELELRPVTLELATSQGTIKLIGRSDSVDTECWFELTEQQRTAEPFDTNILTYTLLLDFTGGNIQPSLTYLEGTINLPNIGGGQRAIHRQYPIQMGHFLGIRLAGDFFHLVTLWRSELELRPVTCELLTSSGIIKLIGRSDSVTTQVFFEVTEQMRTAEPFDTDLLVWYLVYDAAGGPVTPKLFFTEGERDFAPLSGTPRQLHRVALTQMGHLLGIIFQGNYFNATTWFRAELELRPVTFELITAQGPVKLIGRSEDVRRDILFELNQQQRYTEPFDQLMHHNRFLIEGQGGTVTPVIRSTEGDLPLPSTPMGAWHMHQTMILRQRHFLGLTLQGDFFTQTLYYRGELELRALVCTVVTTDMDARQFNASLQLQGRSVALESNLTFEVQEAQRYQEPYEILLQTERVTIDADIQASSITPVLEYLHGTHTLPGFAGPGRRLFLDIPHRLGHLVGLTLQGDFTQSVLLRRVEIEMRAVYLSVMIEDKFTNERIPARMLVPGDGIYFEIPEQLFYGLGSTQMTVLKRLTLDINAAGTPVTPTIITDKGAKVLPTLTAGSRVYHEWPLGLPARPKQLLLAFDVRNIDTFYSVELHVYAPNYQR